MKQKYYEIFEIRIKRKIKTDVRWIRISLIGQD